MIKNAATLNQQFTFKITFVHFFATKTKAIIQNKEQNSATKFDWAQNLMHYEHSIAIDLTSLTQVCRRKQKTASAYRK